MNGERFYVIETRGCAISPQVAVSGGRMASSFAVLDRLNCHRDLAAGRFYASEGGHLSEEARRQRAEALAAELNEWDRAARCA